MSHVPRTALIMLLVLMTPMALWAAPDETITIGATPTGPTAALCLGPNGQYKAIIQILDNPVYYRLSSATAVPSVSAGGLAPANTIIAVDHATDFRAVRVGSDARAYVVCVP